MVPLNVNSWRSVGGLPGLPSIGQLQFIFQPWKEQMCSDLTPVEQQQGSVTFFYCLLLSYSCFLESMDGFLIEYTPAIVLFKKVQVRTLKAL